MKLLGLQIPGLFDHCIDQLEVFSHFHAMAEVDSWCIYAGDKQVDGYNFN